MSPSISDTRWTVAEAPWSWAGLGNHRVILQVDRAAPGVMARIAWRRRDEHPNAIGIRVFELSSGREVVNILPRHMTRECGEIIFEAAVAGRYALYYLPFDIGGKTFYAPHVTYRRADDAGVDPAWLRQIRDARNLPQASVEEIQARTAMDRFDPMERIATADEKAAVLARHAGAAFLLFPEDRQRPIRMTTDMPEHWAATGPAAAFSAAVQPNEYFTFQLGLYATQLLAGVQVTFSDLLNAAGDVIPAGALTCFNVGGVDGLGRAFAKTVNVPASTVQPLWLGVDVPASAHGCYSGSVRVSAEGVPAQTVALSLICSGALLPDRGDADLWKQSRLRWLNSTLGLDDEPAAGYPAVTLSGTTATVLGRDITFGPTGLPERVISRFAPSVDRLQDTPVEVLARPVMLVAQTAAGPLPWAQGRVCLTQPGAGAVMVDAAAQAPELKLTAKTRLEFDGHLDCRLTVTATMACELTDLALEIPLRREVAVYMMGLGRKGGYRPDVWRYEWNRDRSNHHCWLGTVNAGLHLKLKHDEDRWDLTNLQSSGFPTGWYNDGQGGCSVTENGDEEVVLRAFCGPRTLGIGETVSLRFSLIVTPVKLLDLRGHWQQRYHHIDCSRGRNPSIEEAQRVGATVVNLHQGGTLNPYINYPFQFASEMRAEAAAAHAAGLKYKLYYTVRELSHHAEEIWAFRSLDGEIYQESGAAVIADQFATVEERADVAGGTGGPWLREHLVRRYVPAWQQKLPDGELDQAIATAGLSRLHNHYLEGLAWLIRDVGMDGIYLDGVGYDRQIMKRLRKTMDRTRPGCLIDFHSGNNFQPAYGLNNVLSLYMELLPYVDSLWLGEGFDYNESPDYYLTEICGIPFGLTNDMLQGGGNPWRGMIYGMTCRYGWQRKTPEYIWRLWRECGITDARMYGYWVPDCPVKTDHPQVLATVYVRPDGKTLIALASWALEPVACRLAFNWPTLGIARENARLTAPAVQDFQEMTRFDVAAPVGVAPGRGWLLILEPVQT